MHMQHPATLSLNPNQTSQSESKPAGTQQAAAVHTHTHPGATNSKMSLARCPCHQRVPTAQVTPADGRPPTHAHARARLPAEVGS